MNRFFLIMLVALAVVLPGCGKSDDSGGGGHVWNKKKSDKDKHPPPRPPKPNKYRR